MNKNNIVSLSSNPKVSVIVTANGRKEFISKAITSLIEQKISKSEFEVIVVKNFKDKNLETSCLEHGFKLVHTDGIQGAFLSEGLKSASANILAFLDDDDIWSLDHLERLVSVFQKYPDLGYYQNTCKYIDSEGNSADYWHPSKRGMSFRNKEVYITSDQKIQHISQLKKMSADFNLSSIAVKREVIEDHLMLVPFLQGFPDGILFYLALCSNSSIFLDNTIGTFYRIHVKRSSNSTMSSVRRANTIKNLMEYLNKVCVKNEIMKWLEIELSLNNCLTAFRNPSPNRRQMLSNMYRTFHTFSLESVKIPIWRRILILGLFYSLSPNLFRKIYERVMG